MEKKLTGGNEISLSCTWGDGPDVAVNIRGDLSLQKLNMIGGCTERIRQNDQ